MESSPALAATYPPTSLRPSRRRRHVTFRGSALEGLDGERVAELGQLSGREPPRGAVLLAEAAGHVVAAIGIFDGRYVADPTRSTTALRLRLRLFRLQIRAIVGLSGL